MQCRLTRRMESSRRPGTWDEPGTLIEHPKCWYMVMMGCARPADDECRQACEAAGYTEENWQRAVKAYDRIERGIDPDDHAAFDAGAMTGYDDHGEWIPGPNYDQWVEEHGEPEEEEEEEEE